MHQRGIISIKVFYTWGEKAAHKYDPGFDRSVQWDIPLLNGYDFAWLQNISQDPGTHHFKGIINPAAARKIQEYNPDALLVFGWAWQSHLKIIRHFSGKIPVYFRGDSTVLVKSAGVKAVLRYFFLTWVYRHIDAAFFVGTSNRAYFVKYGLKNEQLIFAPHAVDNARFEIKRDAEVADLRASLNLSAEDVLILYAGKFEPVKNLELLLGAFVLLGNPRVHLLLAGGGPSEGILKSMADQSKVKANIHFSGFKNQSDMPVLYQAADLFCLPSTSETWGLVINEAMACGRPVLVSDTVGCSADLVTELNGAIFKSGDREDLTNKLKMLTSDRQQLRNMGAHSRLIIEDWKFCNIAEAIENKIR